MPVRLSRQKGKRGSCLDEKMKKALDEALLEGEQVLWESGTQPFRLLHGREGRRTALQWCISTLFFAAFVAICVTQGTTSVKAWAAALAIYAALMLSPVLSYHQVLAVRYFLTDRRRALLIKKDGTVCAMRLAGDTPARLFSLKPGAAVSIGETVVGEKDRQLRWRTIHALGKQEKTDDDNAAGLVFYNVAHADEAMRILTGRGEGED